MVLAPDDLRSIEAVHGLGEGVVVGIADASNRWLDAGIGKALGVFDRDLLHTTIAVMDEASLRDGHSIVKRLLQGIE